MPIKKQTTKKVKKTAVRRADTVKEQSMVSFGGAIARFFRKYFQFSGVATRAEYWWMFLFMILCAVGFAVLVFGIALVIASMHSIQAEAHMQSIVFMLFMLSYAAVIIPWYALMSRRLHDAGFTAKLLWISILFSVFSVVVPTIRDMAVVDWLGWMWTVVLYILFLFPSKTKNNPYRE